MKVLMDISSRADIPPKITSSPYFTVLKSDSYKFLIEYLSSIPDSQMAYIFVWAESDLDRYLKIIEDYSGSITLYRCSKGDNKDLPISTAFLSRFNLALTRKYKNVTPNLEFAPTSPNLKLFQASKKLFGI